MSQSDRSRQGYIAAVMVYGPDVSEDVLDMLSVQLELFLEELDRAASESDSPRFRWTTVEPSFDGDWVLVSPTPEPTGAAARTAARVMDNAHRGISLLTGRPQPPPGFTTVGLTHLAWLASALWHPGVDRLIFYAGWEQTEITLLTLKHLQSLVEKDPAGEQGSS